MYIPKLDLVLNAKVRSNQKIHAANFTSSELEHISAVMNFSAMSNEVQCQMKSRIGLIN